MKKKIIKRNGDIVEFNKYKIIEALEKAFLEVDGQIYEYDTIYEIASDVERIIPNNASIEKIQDLVEDLLMVSERRDVAKAYIRYRYKREVAREQKDDLTLALKSKIDAKDIENQNANMDEKSFGGRVGQASDLVLKELALNSYMCEKSKKNHLNNEIYIHDLSSYAIGQHNCLSIPLDDLLAKGFNTRQTDVRPANSVNTAFQLVAVIFQIQSLMQFGGVASTHFDWTMVPYVRKSFFKHYKDGIKYIDGRDEIDYSFHDGLSIEESDYKVYSLKAYDYAIDMTRKEVAQAAEGLFHNLNTLQSRSGNQLPFSSINLGTCTSAEGRMVTKAILETCYKGLGKHQKTSIFPCLIFQLKKGINRKPGDVNYDLFQLALKCTAKRLYPNYANCDWSGNEGYDPDDPRTYFSTMGCRTANGWDINGFGQLKDGRGNICPVTIIMPTIAMQAKTIWEQDVENQEDLETIFLNLLDKKIEEAKDMLLERFEWICAQSPSSAKFMYENNVMAGYIPEEGIRSALVHGTLAVGQLGLAETLQILVGCDHTEAKGMNLAKHIEQLFKNRCAEYKEKYKLNFGVYFTPAENLAYTAMKKFQAHYGKISNISDRDYFTNSMHVPVWKKMSPFEKIDIESQLTGYSSAGCITYIELESSIKNNLQALETMVNYAMDKDIPYFAVNVPCDQCTDCGYLDEIGQSCPQCKGFNIQRLRRVTGYLTGNYQTAFNKGKIAEVQDRVKHQ